MCAKHRPVAAVRHEWGEGRGVPDTVRSLGGTVEQVNKVRSVTDRNGQPSPFGT